MDAGWAPEFASKAARFDSNKKPPEGGSQFEPERRSNGQQCRLGLPPIISLSRGIVYWSLREFEGFDDLILLGHGMRSLLGLKEKAARRRVLDSNG
jgi:hypothetical protein